MSNDKHTRKIAVIGNGLVSVETERSELATLRAEKAELIEALRGAWDALKEADRRFSVKTGNALSEQIKQTLAKYETE
jgi:hypothetical protein